MKKILIIASCLIGILFFQNCSSSKNATALVPVVSFDKDVLPILTTSCTPCHFPPNGKKAFLNTYDAVKIHISDMIARVKISKDDDKFMPFKLKKPALTDSAINVLVEWEKQGMPK